ncbi:DUF4435 domain-containing protein [Synechocystis sp. PCC 7338]|uniref:DUF4435 domain-containing protein n=1 Tax=Synechocystis sp. PCC 7338 TaxID=2732530 RepID=UPI001BB087AD|nr:DUF4435 domain-containing protein [Synechocystis sp. PCC 7338]QUS62497.1 DUF4435 domain-containing protein [Synechocystis sp. PCC 7338]
MKINLPAKKGTPNTDPEVEFEQLVVVGANGAGKTRFGSRIEQLYPSKTHRISAQKSLTFPSYISPTSRNRAELSFKYGKYFDHFTNETQYYSQKINSRWSGNFNTSLLNDFDKLLVLLHTEEYEDSLSYKEGRIGKPTTKLDRVQNIWETVLPHRKLHKTAGVIETYPTGDIGGKYNASEMSDGERVIFYLIGEVICAAPESIIIIDEPEMHIHKSLIKTLFDLIEIERPDCPIIYLTHEIDFAFTRHNALKIWAKSYENSVWDYEILDETTPIPEQLYLEILGSRKPILFLEGDNSSIDYELYNHVYNDKTIKPIGSCDKVIQIVKAFREQQDFHHIESFGIIDRDRRQEGDLVNLNSRGIWVLDVAEAENLLLIEPIVKSIANHMGKDADDVFNQVKQNIISFFTGQLDSQVLIHFKEVLRREYLTLTNFSSTTIGDVITEIDTSFSSINMQAVYDSIQANFQDILTGQDYNSILRVFNLKNALIPNSKICELTGLRNKTEYKNATLTLLKRNNLISENIKVGIDEKIIKNAT